MRTTLDNKNKHIENSIILNNIQMFSKYKCLAQESIYNVLDEAYIQSNKLGPNDSIFENNKEKINLKLSISFLNISKNIIKLSFPTIFFYFMLYFQQTICLSFLGSYNNQDMLNGYGIISLYLTCTLQCILSGVVSGLDTLLPNAWSNNNIRLFNIYVQRSKIMCILLSFPLSIISYLTASPLLKCLNINKNTLTYGNRFLLSAILSNIIDSLFNINFTILAVINKIKETLLSLFASILLHFFWCYFLIIYLNMDIIGAGLALNISSIFNVLSSSFLIYRYNKFTSKLIKNNIITKNSLDNDINDFLESNSNSNPYNIELLFRIDKEIAQGLFSYAKFIFPNTILLAAEWMAFEIQGIIALSLGVNSYSIHLILSNLAHLTNTFSSGFGLATAILIAEKIGKLVVKESKFIAVYSFLIAQLFMSVIVVFLIIFRNQIFQIFIENNSDNADVLKLGNECVVFLAVFSVVDATESVMAGVFRGYGKQKIASIIALIQYYIIQTIMSWILGVLLNYKIKGIWSSIVIGAISTTLTYFFVFIMYFDFSKILIETKERIESDSRLLSIERVEFNRGSFNKKHSIELTKSNDIKDIN